VHTRGLPNAPVVCALVPESPPTIDMEVISWRYPPAETFCTSCVRSKLISFSFCSQPQPQLLLGKQTLVALQRSLTFRKTGFLSCTCIAEVRWCSQLISTCLRTVSSQGVYVTAFMQSTGALQTQGLGQQNTATQITLRLQVVSSISEVGEVLTKSPSDIASAADAEWLLMHRSSSQIGMHVPLAVER